MRSKQTKKYSTKNQKNLRAVWGRGCFVLFSEDKQDWQILGPANQNEERTQINRIRTSSERLQQTPKKFQDIIREHFKNLYSIKLENLKEILDSSKPLMLNQEEKNNLNRPITKEFEVKLKILLWEKINNRHNWIHSRITPDTFTDLQLILPKIFFSKIEREGVLPHSSIKPVSL